MNYLQVFIQEVIALQNTLPQFNKNMKGLFEECFYYLSQNKQEKVSFLPSSTDFLHKELLFLQEKLDSPLEIAILGQFSSGKSSFLNAILGEDLLPTGITPITSKVCYIRYGESPMLQIHYHSGRVELAPVSVFGQIERSEETSIYLQEGNIAYFTLFHPSPLLKSINFIDTPGFNSQNEQDTQTTENILHSVEAIIWLTLIDNVGKQSEKEILQAHLKAHASKAICILNQKDRLKNDTEIHQSLEYAKETFREFFREFFAISAKEAITAFKLQKDNKKEESTKLLELSGIKEVFRVFDTLRGQALTLKQINVLNTLTAALLQLKRNYLHTKIALQNCNSNLKAQSKELLHYLSDNLAAHKSQINILYLHYQELIHFITQEIYNALQKQYFSINLPKSNLFTNKKIFSKEILEFSKSSLVLKFTNENSPFFQKLKSLIAEFNRFAPTLASDFEKQLNTYNQSLQTTYEYARKKGDFCVPFSANLCSTSPILLETKGFEVFLKEQLLPFITLLQSTFSNAIVLSLEQLEGAIRKPIVSLLEQATGFNRAQEATPTSNTSTGIEDFTPYLPTLENIRDLLGANLFVEKFATSLETIQGRTTLADKSYLHGTSGVKENLEQNMQIFNEKIDTIQKEIEKFNAILRSVKEIRKTLE